MVLRAGHSYSYFVRTKHFRLSEKSGRSPVIYGVLRGELTNGRSSVVSEKQTNYTITNGRSSVSQQKTEFVLDTHAGPVGVSIPNLAGFGSHSGPSLHRPPASEVVDLSAQNATHAGPSHQSVYSNGVEIGGVGPSVHASGDYLEIVLINKFGHRGEQTSVRGFNVAQTQPRPRPFDFIDIPPALDNPAFAVWLDASDKDDGKILASPMDNTIIRWDNKAPSGSSWSQNGSTAMRPVFVENALNGLGGVSFNGSSQMMTNTGLGLASTSGEIFVVVVQSGKPANPNLDTIWGASTAAAPDKFLALRPYESRGGFAGPAISANNTAGIKENVYEEGTSDTIASGVPYIMNFRSLGLGTPWQVDVNGSGLTGNTVLFAAHEGVWHGAMGGLDTINLGSIIVNSATIEPWHGMLHELIAYESPLTPAARSGVVSYLENKWNVALTGVL